MSAEPDIHCARGKAALIWPPDPKPDDFVVCPSCCAWGRYEEVIREGAGLIGALPKEKCENLVKKIRLLRKGIPQKAAALGDCEVDYRNHAKVAHRFAFFPPQIMLHPLQHG